MTAALKREAVARGAVGEGWVPVASEREERDTPFKTKGRKSLSLVSLAGTCLKRSSPPQSFSSLSDGAPARAAQTEEDEFVLHSTSLLLSQEVFLLYEHLRAIYIAQSHMKRFA